MWFSQGVMVVVWTVLWWCICTTNATFNVLFVCLRRPRSDLHVLGPCLRPLGCIYQRAKLQVTM